MEVKIKPINKKGIDLILKESALTETRNEVNLRTIEYHSYFEKIDLKIGLPEKIGVFNKFMGFYIGKMLHIEELMQMISLELISRGDHAIRNDIYDFFIAPNNFMLGKHFQFFNTMVKNNFEYYDDSRKFFDSIHLLIEKLITLRNTLAHSHPSYVYIKEEKTLNVGHIKNIDANKKISIVYSDRFKKEVASQVQMVERYLLFLKDCIFYKNASMTHLLLFYYKVGIVKTKLHNGDKGDGTKYQKDWVLVEYVEQIISGKEYGINIINKQKAQLPVQAKH